MTVELIREIAGHLLALGVMGWGAYLTINGQPVPEWLIAAIGAVVGVYFPGMAMAARARLFCQSSKCCD